MENPWASRSLRGQMLHIGLVGGGVAMLWWMTSGWSLSSTLRWVRQRFGAKGAQLTRSELLSVLDDIGKEFHGVFMQLAQMVKKIKENMHSRGLGDAVSTEEMGALLMEQRFRSRLEEIQEGILNKKNVTTKMLEAASELAMGQGDVEVKLRVEGLEKMYSDATKGELPLLPVATLSDFLSDPNNVLEIMEDILKKRVDLFSVIFKTADPSTLEVSPSPRAGAIPSPELSAALSNATNEAETDTLERRKADIGEALLYHHALAYHSRNPDFDKKRAILEDKYSDKVVALMRIGLRRADEAKLNRNNPEPPVVVHLHDKLEQVNEGTELSALLASCGDETDETNEPVRRTVCLVTEKANDSQAVIGLAALSMALNAVDDALFERTAFLTTTRRAVEDITMKDILGQPEHLYIPETLSSSTDADSPSTTTLYTHVSQAPVRYILFEGGIYKGTTLSVTHALAFAQAPVTRAPSTDPTKESSSSNSPTAALSDSGASHPTSLEEAGTPTPTAALTELMEEAQPAELSAQESENRAGPIVEMEPSVDGVSTGSPPSDTLTI